MAAPALDTAAWTGAWRHRSVVEKLVLTGGLLVLAVGAPTPTVALAVAGVGVLTALGLARVPAGTYLRALAVPAGFVLVGALTVAVTFDPVGPGTLWQTGPLTVSQASVDRALLVTGRALAGAAALVLLAATTPMVDLIGALRRLRVPDAVLDVAGLTYRMLFSLLAAADSIRAAQAARLGYATGPAARRSVGQLGAAVLLRSWRRARGLEEGLAGRGYDGALLTLAPHRPVSRTFVLASLGLLLALAVVAVLVGGRA